MGLRQGTVDIHGQPRSQTWTRLSTTAFNGSTQIDVQHAVDWPLGSQIIIATTGDYLSQRQNELRSIVGVLNNGYRLVLDAPLDWTHLGVSKLFGSTLIEARAEVGLLSHNIVFQGSISETWNQTIEACPQDFNPGKANRLSSLVEFNCR